MSDSLGSRGAVGSCFGYAVRAPFPVMALRSGEGAPLEVFEDDSLPKDVGEPLLNWVEGDRSLVRLYQQSSQYLLWVEGNDWFRVDPDAPSITCIGSAAGPRREARIFGLPSSALFHGPWRPGRPCRRCGRRRFRAAPRGSREVWKDDAGGGLRGPGIPAAR